MSRVDRSVGDLVAKLPPDAAVVKCGDLRSAVQTPTVDYGEEHIDGFRLQTLLVLPRGQGSSEPTRGLCGPS